MSGLISRSAKRELEGINILGSEKKQKEIQAFTMLAPTMSTIICAKSFELQAHIKGSLLFEDLLDGQIAFIRRSSTWWKASFPDKSIQSLV